MAWEPGRDAAGDFHSWVTSILLNILVSETRQFHPSCLSMLMLKLCQGIFRGELAAVPGQNHAPVIGQGPMRVSYVPALLSCLIYT